MEEITFEPRILLYESEAIRIASYARSSPSLEIGGDLIGFYEPGGSPLIFVASGPGPGSQRDATHFQQDSEFQMGVFNKLATRFRMFYVGDWHSHHSLGLSEPSGSDDAKLRDLADKNGWPVLYSLIVQTESSSRSSTRNPSTEGFGIWWNCFLYRFGRQAGARRRVQIEFQRGENPYFSAAEEVNITCKAVSSRWSQESVGLVQGSRSRRAEQAETGLEIARDEFVVGVYQQICKVIAAELNTAEMEVDLDHADGARLLVSDGPKQVMCRVSGSREGIEVTVDSGAGKQQFELRFRRGRINLSDIGTMASRITSEFGRSTEWNRGEKLPR